MSNGQALPILIAGGGIGGLAAAHALARKGFAVRVLEQAPEFREIGAGIQLGPNVFRALEKLDLKEAVLADAHRPPAMEMRCALSGERVTRIPLDEPRFRRSSSSPTPSLTATICIPSSSTRARTTTASRWKPVKASKISSRTIPASA